MSNPVHRLSGKGFPKGIERMLLICGEVTSFCSSKATAAIAHEI
jgi:hypothetical protein